MRATQFWKQVRKNPTGSNRISRISKQKLAAPLISVCFLAVGASENEQNLDWRSLPPDSPCSEHNSGGCPVTLCRCLSVGLCRGHTSRWLLLFKAPVGVGWSGLAWIPLPGWNVTPPSSLQSHWIKAGLERNTRCARAIGWQPLAPPPPSSFHSRAVVSPALSHGFVRLRQNNWVFVAEMTLAIPLSLGEGRIVCWEGQGVVVQTGRTRLRNLRSGLKTHSRAQTQRGSVQDCGQCAAGSAACSWVSIIRCCVFSGLFPFAAS